MKNEYILNEDKILSADEVKFVNSQAENSRFMHN